MIVLLNDKVTSPVFDTEVNWTSGFRMTFSTVLDLDYKSTLAKAAAQLNVLSGDEVDPLCVVGAA